jgi:acetyltransferase-like isoleucine patch superfamily enzyme
MKRLVEVLLAWLAPLPFFALAIFAAGLALAVAAYVFELLYQALDPIAVWAQFTWLGISLAVGYAVYGIALILIAPTLNFILRSKLKPYRGYMASWSAVRWYVHCTLTLVVRLSFLEFVTPSPFNLLFYRLMGMKIGRNVVINSSAIADPSLIELQDGVIIGGTASITAHYARGGRLIISPVIIRSNATIGLRAIVMGGADIGERATLLANSFLLPQSKIPPGETWGGIPAKKIDVAHFAD